MGLLNYINAVDSSGILDSVLPVFLGARLLYRGSESTGFFGHSVR